MELSSIVHITFVVVFLCILIYAIATSNKKMNETKIVKKNGLIWYKYCEGQLPQIGEEVLAFNEKWIDQDINPKGIRIGFRDSDGFTSAYWWDMQDDYTAISNLREDLLSKYFQNQEGCVDPEWWTHIPSFK